MSRRVTTLAFVALLLFAQHASIVHALWHAHGENEQQQSGTHEDERQSQPLEAQLCALDAVFAQVLGGGFGGCNALVVHDTALDPVALGAALSFSQRFLAPLSRGPPTLL